jgi:hypothetical protein
MSRLVYPKLSGKSRPSSLSPCHVSSRGRFDGRGFGERRCTRDGKGRISRLVELLSSSLSSALLDPSESRGNPLHDSKQPHQNPSQVGFHRISHLLRSVVVGLQEDVSGDVSMAVE